MKKRWVMALGATLLATLVGVATLALVMAAHPERAAAAASCTPTGFMRDNINLTAALINPSGAVSGVVDATGCDIGVYYGPGVRGTVDQAEIENAVYFGVLNNGAVVTVEDSRIHNIGDPGFSGDQHGVGVYWAYGSAAQGKIVNNTIWNYQKGGIVVNGAGSAADVRGNIVTGLGHINFNAQNGIQIGYGARANVMDNTVSDNSYTGTSTVAGGIVVVGGPCYSDVYTTDIQIEGNTAINNDVGIWLSNVQADCASAPTTSTNIKVVNNTISNDGVYNDYGGAGYQAGIADQGDNDKIIHNSISGAGYNPASSATAYLVAIDASSSFTNRVKVHANNVK